MIPNLTKGAGIKGTALYVLHDERQLEDVALGDMLSPEAQSAERVGFTATRNLPTDNPELAWRLMCTTAKNQDELKRAAGVHAGGRRTEKFCGHLSLSWEHGEQPGREEMLKAADGALTAMGWEKLQALIVEHKDHDHAHCHIVVNLIDPETGKAAPNAKNDYEKLQAWAYEYEKERGKIVCADRARAIEEKAAGVDRQQQDEKPKRWLSRSEWEAQRDAAKAAGQERWKEQQADRAAVLQETKAQARTVAAEVREEFRPEWAELYKKQRGVTANLERATDPAKKPTKAAYRDFMNSNVALLVQGIRADLEKEAAKAGKDAPTEGTLRQMVQERWADLQRPGELQKVVTAALTEQRAELKAKEDAAHHAAQRGLWAEHKARMDELTQRQRGGDQRTNPPPVPNGPEKPQERPTPVSAPKAPPKPPEPTHRPTTVVIGRYEVLRQEQAQQAQKMAEQAQRSAEKIRRDPAPEKMRQDPAPEKVPLVISEENRKKAQQEKAEAMRKRILAMQNDPQRHRDRER